MIQLHSSRLISGVTVTQGSDMQSDAIIVNGFRFLAIVRQTMSRSVTTPIGFVVPSSQTGISPQSSTTIIAATSCKIVSGAQHVGSAVIISLTFIMSVLLYIVDIWLLSRSVRHAVTASQLRRE